MGKQKLFNNEQEEFILNNYITMSNEEIANELNCGVTRQQINSWLIHRGIKRNGYGCKYKNRIFSESDVEFIINNYKTMTYSEIGKILGFTSNQVKGKVTHLGLETKKRQINKNYFENIDTPLKAYMIGFIYADGWVIHNKNTSNYEFGMELQSQDKYILEKLNEELGGQNLIYHKNPKDILIYGDKPAHCGHSDVLRVYSKKLVCDLIYHGIETNKSQKCTVPVVDDNLFFDFLRGYIDGDGCFYTDNGYTYMHIISASEKPLKYIQNKLFKFGIETHIYSENDKKYRLMCINSKEMKKLVSRLYYESDLFCLYRKYEKIKHFLGLAA